MTVLLQYKLQIPTITIDPAKQIKFFLYLSIENVIEAMIVGRHEHTLYTMKVNEGI
jgi:hypothetical protein